jgi:hypothetical protein
VSGCDHPLIARFRKIDAESEPAGIYGADTELLWSKCVFPVLKRQGGKITLRASSSRAYFTDGDGREGVAELLTLSAVKVRKFGHKFATDSRVDFHDRWSNRRMQKKICELWAEGGPMKRVLVMVGFDDSDSPFEKEFANLAREIDWAAHGVIHERRAWPDPKNRRFSCVVAVWER